MKRLTLTGFLAIAMLAPGCTKDDAASDPAAKVTTEPAPNDNAAPETVTSVSITSSAPGAIALFREGRTLQEGFRFAEATTKYKKAIELDPDFALGHAYLAMLDKGEASMEHKKRAAELAAKLPEPERLLVQSVVSESEEAREKALAKLASKAPGDWQVQVMVARMALKKNDPEAARAAFEKAAELNPKAAYPYNNLAYLYAEEGDFDKAVASVTKYAELSPGEPNPLDSKGEILLMAGKFAESEAAFAEALKLADDFAIAHEGIAATKFYRGDWKGGVAELRVGTKKATRAIDRHELENKLGWALAAAGKDKEAKEAFAAATRSAREAGIAKQAGEEATMAAELALEKGDYAAAEKQAEKAIAEMIADGAPAKKQNWALAMATIAAARAGHLPAADKSLASLAVDAKGSHYLAYAEAHVAMAKGNYTEAIKAAAELKNDKWFSGRASLITAEALAASGNAEKAKEIRSELATRYRRDIHSVILAEQAKKAAMEG